MLSAQQGKPHKTICAEVAYGVVGISIAWCVVAAGSSSDSQSINQRTFATGCAYQRHSYLKLLDGCSTIVSLFFLLFSWHKCVLAEHQRRTWALWKNPNHICMIWFQISSLSRCLTFWFKYHLRFTSVRALTYSIIRFLLRQNWAHGHFWLHSAFAEQGNASSIPVSSFEGRVWCAGRK